MGDESGNEKELEAKLADMDVLLEERKKIYGALAKIRRDKALKERKRIEEEEEIKRRRKENEEREKEKKRLEDIRFAKFAREPLLEVVKLARTAKQEAEKALVLKRAENERKVMADTEEARAALEALMKERQAFYEAQLVDDLTKITEAEKELQRATASLQAICSALHPQEREHRGYREKFVDEVGEGRYVCCSEIVTRVCKDCGGTWQARVEACSGCPAGN